MTDGLARIEKGGASKKYSAFFDTPPSSNVYFSVSKSQRDLFLEITVVETLETLTVTGFVFSHFMNSIMDSIQIQSFSAGCDTFLVFACT